MIDPKDCTIIIPHLGATEESRYALQECLKSLDESAPDIRKIVVFNGEPELVGKNIFSHPLTPYDAVIVLDQGQCKAVNAAAATVNTPWIFVTNDDMVYAPGWWELLNTGLIYDDNDKILDINDEEVKCLSPMLVEPRPGAPTFVVQPFGGAGGDFDKDKWDKFAFDWHSLIGWRKGFNLPFLIKKELWDLIGGYDINYDPWGSNGDSDLEYKIKLAGVQPYQNTNCIVYHFSQTSGTFNPDNDSHRFRNYAYFKEKWGFDRTDDGIWEATFEIPDEGRIFRPWWEGFYGS